MFERLNYRRLASIYCYEGGNEFWRTKRESCRRLGMRMGGVLLTRLAAGGRSLYVGAGVAELPVLLVESLELHRTVRRNLRSSEVATLNRAVAGFLYSSCDGWHCRGL
jgi:hypothetical protein